LGEDKLILQVELPAGEVLSVQTDSPSVLPPEASPPAAVEAKLRQQDREGRAKRPLPWDSMEEKHRKSRGLPPPPKLMDDLRTRLRQKRLDLQEAAQITSHPPIMVGEQTATEVMEGKGKKDDADKPRYDLFPCAPLEALAKLYAMGAKKYGDRNWENGLRWGRVYRAMIGHAVKWWQGEKYDPVDFQHHLSSVVWGAFALMEYENTHPELDDRVKKPKWFGQSMSDRQDATHYASPDMGCDGVDYGNSTWPHLKEED